MEYTTHELKTFLTPQESPSMSEIYLQCPDPDCQQNGLPWEHGYVIQRDPKTHETHEISVIFCPHCEVPLKYDNELKAHVKERR